ncbi:MAG: hypothetical protein PHX30_01690 [Candidatus Pacebacteria bacterium]|jgi:hypothetical protein|nr:hypothetical protein [Candidatus Paceibacterota bacterium]
MGVGQILEFAAMGEIPTAVSYLRKLLGPGEVTDKIKELIEIGDIEDARSLLIQGRQS